jgi:hypothetical protein
MTNQSKVIRADMNRLSGNLVRSGQVLPNALDFQRRLTRSNSTSMRTITNDDSWILLARRTRKLATRPFLTQGAIRDLDTIMACGFAEGEFYELTGTIREQH